MIKSQRKEPWKRDTKISNHPKWGKQNTLKRNSMCTSRFRPPKTQKSSFKIPMEGSVQTNWKSIKVRISILKCPILTMVDDMDFWPQTQKYHFFTFLDHPGPQILTSRCETNRYTGVLTLGKMSSRSKTNRSFASKISFLTKIDHENLKLRLAGSLHTRATIVLTRFKTLMTRFFMFWKCGKSQKSTPHKNFDLSSSIT